MKILKIREGKLKLSLSAEEAGFLGLGASQVISGEDLSLTIRRLIREEIEGEGWEKLLIEPYPRVDGSYEIFVSGECVMEKRKERCDYHYYAFEKAEYLAYALYMLSEGAKPEKGQSGDFGVTTTTQARPPRESSHKEESVLPDEVLSLFTVTKGKCAFEKSENIKSRLPPFSLYRTEDFGSQKGTFSYILAIDEKNAEGLLCLVSLCEFGRELKGVTEEQIEEHAVPVGIGQLLNRT